MSWWTTLLGWLRPKPPVPPVPVPPGPEPDLGWVATLLELHNNLRVSKKLNKLSVNAELTQAAIGWCSWMVIHNIMTHGTNFSSRVRQAGYNFSYLGENIAKGQRTPNEVFNAWYHSPGHYRNMVNPNFKDIGLSFKADSNGVMYWVIDFGSRAVGNIVTATAEDFNLPGGIDATTNAD